MCTGRNTVAIIRKLNPGGCLLIGGFIAGTCLGYHFVDEHTPQQNGLVMSMLTKSVNMLFSSIIFGIPAGAMGWLLAGLPCDIGLQALYKRLDDEYERSCIAPVDEEDARAPVSDIQMSEFRTYQGANIGMWESKQNDRKAVPPVNEARPLDAVL